MIKRFFMLVLCSMLLFSPVNAQNVSKTGTTAASFLEIAVGSSAIGMGGAYVSVARDASSLYWNAAGIATLEKYEVLISHSEWIAETNFDFAGLVLPLGNFGTLGLSLTSLSMGDMMVRTVEQPEGTGEFFSAGDLAFGISYARNLTDRFSIGFTAKYIQQSIWHMRSTAFAIDLGTLFKTDLFGGMTIGASISNFGTSMQLEGRDTRYFIRVDESKQGSNERIPVNVDLDSWDLPLIFQIGVSTYALNTEQYKFMLAADAVHPINDYESISVGGEFSFFNSVFVRGGYKNLFLIDGEGGLTLGVGVNSKMLFSEVYFNFDYAYHDFGRLSNVHNFSIGLNF
jgi:hypothetical protein